MSNSQIRAELETRLKAWADAQTPVVPIAFQYASFTKPTTPYLECFLLPNATVNHDVAGNRKTHIGLFQVNCWAPSGSGMGVVETLAQSVIQLFPLVPKVGSVSIESTPAATHAMHDEAGWVIVPVTIKYRMESF